jgi:hypothetical protein
LLIDGHLSLSLSVPTFVHILAATPGVCSEYASIKPINSESNEPIQHREGRALEVGCGSPAICFVHCYLPHRTAVQSMSSSASTPSPTGLREAVWAKVVFASIGCSVAGATTNPIDVIKIRLQLQGELARSSTLPTSNRVYKGLDNREAVVACSTCI